MRAREIVQTGDIPLTTAPGARPRIATIRGPKIPATAHHMIHPKIAIQSSRRHHMPHRAYVLPALAGLLLAFVSSSALAQYQPTFLTSDLSGKAKHTDPLLKNAWGLAYSPSAPFWVSDEADGWSTLYDGQGNPQSLQVVVPAASGTGSGSPTGIVYNGSSEFAIDSWTSLFLFATLDGTI